MKMNSQQRWTKDNDIQQRAVEIWMGRTDDDDDDDDDN